MTQSAAAHAAGQLRPVGAERESMDRIAQMTTRLLDTASAQVFLLAGDRTPAHVVGSAGSPTPGHGRGSPACPAQVLSRLAAGRGAAYAVDDAGADPDLAALPRVASGEVGAALAVPLTGSTGEVLGALCALAPAPRAWTPADVETLEALADFARDELERRAPDRDLEQDRARWELAAGAGDLGSFDWDLVSGEVTWDDRLTALHGYDDGGVPFGRDLAGVAARVHPDDLRMVDRLVKEAVATVSSLTVSYRAALPGGQVRWLEARGRALAGPDGVATRLIGVSWDVTAEHENELRADRVLGSMTVGYLAMDADWRVTYVNEEGARLVRRSAVALVGSTLWELFPETVGSVFDEAYRRVARTRRPESLEAFYPAPLNRWYEIRVTPDAGGGLALYFLDVTERRLDQDLLQLAVEMSDQMLGVVDVDDAVAALARQVVPLLADWSIVTMVEPDGLRDVDCWHPDPELRRVVEQFAAHRLTGGGSGLVQQVLRTREPVAVSQGLTDYALASLPSEEARQAVARLAPESVLTVPIMSGRRVAGILSLARGAGRAPASDRETAVTSTLCRRAGMAIDNARLYAEQRAAAERDRTAAEALQQALLSTLPEPEDLALTARYRTAADGDQVGGDWYDAVTRAGEGTTVMIGDVVGHDIRAAATMGQLRTMLRMLALRPGDSPAAILEALDRAAHDLALDTLATVLTARIEPGPSLAGHGAPAGLTMRWSNAGHPPPVLLHPQGTAELLGTTAPDLMLGVQPDIDRTNHTHVLPPGSTLLLYTDGLIERRGEDLDHGIDRLLDALGRHHGLGTDDLLDRVLDEMLEAHPSDDIAVLAVHVRGR